MEIDIPEVYGIIKTPLHFIFLICRMILTLLLHVKIMNCTEVEECEKSKIRSFKTRWRSRREIRVHL